MADDGSREATRFVAAPQADAPKKPYFLVMSGTRLGEMFELTGGEEAVIGRSEQAQLRFEDEGVSRRHAMVTFGPSGVAITDLGSSNGTFVEGARIEATPLADGSLVHVGGVTLKLLWASPMEAEIQQRIAQAAIRDVLTGLFNRRHFEERVRAEISAARRHTRALSLLIVDLDHFKRINDTYGHAAGDEVLRVAARTIQGCVRGEDVVARFGGEEFVILAREAGLTGALALAERVRKRLENAKIAWQGHELAVTGSIGVARWLEDGPGGCAMTELELFTAADSALYTAKNTGRNRVVAASEPGITGNTAVR